MWHFVKYSRITNEYVFASGVPEIILLSPRYGEDNTAGSNSSFFKVVPPFPHITPPRDSQLRVRIVITVMFLILWGSICQCLPFVLDSFFHLPCAQRNRLFVHPMNVCHWDTKPWFVALKSNVSFLSKCFAH